VTLIFRPPPFSAYSVAQIDDVNMFEFLFTCSFAALSLGALSCDANAQSSGDTTLIQSPFNSKTFGMKILAGTEVVEGDACNSDPQRFPDRAQLCIKVPNDSNFRTWWRDQYVEQLVELGWTAQGFGQGLGMDQPPYLSSLRGLRERGCKSSMLVLPVYDGDMRQPIEGTHEPVPVLNATYLIFQEQVPADCYVPGHEDRSDRNMDEAVVTLSVPETINQGAELTLSIRPSDQSIVQDRMAKEGTADALWLGFVLENIETKKRIFLGDASKVWASEFTRIVKLNVPVGTYQVYAYEYNKGIKRRDAGWSRPIKVLPLMEGPIWGLAGTELQLCQNLARTPNYHILETRPINCGTRPCEGGPKFYWTDSGQSVSVMQSFGRPNFHSAVSIQCYPVDPNQPIDPAYAPQ